MGERRNRETRVASELESIATQLRDGEARLSGYHVEIEDGGSVEHGGIASADGWFTFELDRRGSR